MSEKIYMTKAVMGAMVNATGMLFGGVLLSWMDELAGIAAKRYSASEVVTASVNQASFLKPIPLGSFLDLEAQVTKVGNTSMEISLEAWIDERELQGTRRIGRVLAATGIFVYVAVDAEGKAKKVEHYV